MIVRSVEPQDAESWLSLRCELWPDGSAAEHREEIARYFSGRFKREPWAVLLAENDRRQVVGLVELSLRPYAEGCTSTPVAYVEGWYVAAEARRSGVGRTLMNAAEDWGRSYGCRELGSDCAPDNRTSAESHLRLGFSEVGTVQCFRKAL
jgi:aminoglycoside 6'-N-acetyltransferase I